MIFGQNRDELRQMYADAWHKRCDGTPMSPLEGDERKAYYEKGSAGHMIPRAGTSEECAAGAMFLLQNDFTTGTIVDVDGGAIIA